MTPAERQLIADLFDRLATLEGARRDPDAESAIRDGLRRAPNAVYSLVQTTLLQDAALKRADERIRQLEAEGGPSGSFLGGGSGGGLFGRPDDRRGSVPDVRARTSTGAPGPFGGAGQPMGAPAGFGGAGQPMPMPPQGVPVPPQGMPVPPAQRGGGSFLGTAAAAAAGAIGGSLLTNALGRMMGGGSPPPGGPGAPATAHGGGGLPWDAPGGSPGAGGFAGSAPGGGAPGGGAPGGGPGGLPWGSPGGSGGEVGGGLPWASPGGGGDIGRQAGVDDIGRTGASPFESGGENTSGGFLGGDDARHAEAGSPFEQASAEHMAEDNYDADADAGYADDTDWGGDDGGDFGGDGGDFGGGDD